MKYYIRSNLAIFGDNFWIFQFKSTTTRGIKAEKWAFRDPVSMLGSRIIYSSNKKPYPYTTKVIPKSKILDEHELIVYIMEKL